MSCCNDNLATSPDRDPDHSGIETHVVVPILPRTQFNLSFLGAAGTKAIELAKAVNLLAFTDLELVVWIHDRQMSAGQSVSIDGFGTYPSPFDAREFTATISRVNLIITSADAVPSVRFGINDITDPFLKLVMTTTQGATAGAALYVDLSVSLILKRA
jgi:hypothetical protein